MLRPVTRWTPRLQWPHHEGFGALTITVPVAGAAYPVGDVDCTALGSSATGAAIQYQWEFDTADPPDSGNADYQTLYSGYQTSGVAYSVVASALTVGTWYARVRIDDGTSTSGWTATRLFYVFAELMLDPGTAVKTSVLAAANKVYVVVQGSDPLVVASATYDEAGDPMRHSLTPREIVVFLKAGDATIAAAVAAARLAYHQQARVYITGAKTSLHAGGLGITRDKLIAINHAKSGVSGTYPVRRLTFNFADDFVEVELGDYDLAARDDASSLINLAKALRTLEKETGI